MAVIKQLKQFLTGVNLFPVTKTNAVYDDTFGRLDVALQKSLIEGDIIDGDVVDGVVRSMKNPSTNQIVFPATRVDAVYDANGHKLSNYINALYSSPSSNLLINSNFVNPVNQRGKAAYNGNGIYTIDRWMIHSGSVSVGEDSIAVTADESSTAIFQQRLDVPLKELRDKSITISFETSDGIFSYTEHLPSTLGTVQYDSDGYQLNGQQYCDVMCGVGIGFVDIRFVFTGSLTLKWVKVEYGEIATPYVPRLYAEELQLCKRYYKEITGFKSGTVYTTNDITFIFDDIRDMRTAPSPGFKNSTFDGNGVYIAQSLNSGYVDGFVFSLGVASQSNTVRCTATKTSHGLTANSSVIVVPLANPICLDAEL